MSVDLELMETRLHSVEKELTDLRVAHGRLDEQLVQATKAIERLTETVEDLTKTMSDRSAEAKAAKWVVHAIASVFGGALALLGEHFMSSK